MIHKLQAHGIKGNALHSLEGLLKAHMVSISAAVISGIPQGRVLGPILFIVFVNDMPEIVHRTIEMFADDTKIFCEIKDDNDSGQLQDDLKTFEEWSKDRFLRFNAEKSSDASW